LINKREAFRSERQITRVLTTQIYPHWADRAFVGIRRSDVVALLDAIEDENGVAASDWALWLVSAIMHHYARRTDDYLPPLARGMKRQSAKLQARARILDDNEIRALWAATATFFEDCPKSAKITLCLSLHGAMAA
jgi:hypothetical protein